MLIWNIVRWMPWVQQKAGPPEGPSSGGLLLPQTLVPLRAIASPRRLTPGRVTKATALPPSSPPIQPHPWRVTSGGQPRRRGEATTQAFAHPNPPQIEAFPWKITRGAGSGRVGAIAHSVSRWRWMEGPTHPPPTAIQTHPWLQVSGGQPRRRGHVWLPANPLVNAAVAPTSRGRFTPSSSPRHLHGGSVSVARIPSFGNPPSLSFHPSPIARRYGDDRTRRQRGRLNIAVPIWVPTAGQTQYHVYSNAGSGPINYLTPIATVTGLTWTSPPLAYPDDWWFGVRAFNSFGEEQNLDCVVELILDSLGHDITNRPLPPTGLRAFARPAGAVRVEWAYPPTRGAKAPTGFHVYIGLGIPNYTAITATVLFTTGIVNTFVANLSGLADEVVYTIGVRAYNATAEEPNTTTVSVTAEAVGPDAVDNLVGVATAQS